MPSETMILFDLLKSLQLTCHCGQALQILMAGDGDLLLGCENADCPTQVQLTFREGALDNLESCPFCDNIP